MGAQQRLTDLWYREPDRASLLQPLAWLYGAVVFTSRGVHLAASARPIVATISSASAYTWYFVNR